MRARQGEQGDRLARAEQPEDAGRDHTSGECPPRAPSQRVSLQSRDLQ